MTTDNPDRPRKTLTLSKTARPAPQNDDEGRRKRAGARGRLVAQKARVKEKDERLRAPAEAPPTPTPRQPRQEAARRPRETAAPRARAEHRDTAVREREPGARRHRPEHRDTAMRERDPAAPRHRAEPRDTAMREREPAAPRHRPEPRDTAVREREPAAPRHRPEHRDTAMREREPAAATGPRRTRGLHAAERFRIFTPCPQGLEEALTAELHALGFEDAEGGRAGASFTADWSGVQRANLYSRLATRVLVQVAHGPVQHEDDLLDLAYATPWERWFGAEHRLRVDTSAIKSPMRSLQYCNLRVKDGICDRLLDREGARPDIDTVRPDARVFSFLTQDTATLYLDTSGESLFKRGWRLDKGEAPLRENLAAGLLALAGWDPSAPLLDPFCGSGTILIEAAWIALGVPPGIARPFGFERMRGHDARRWHDIKDDARSHIRDQLDTPLFGCDIDPAAIEFARRNAERAGLDEHALRLEVGDARALTEAPSSPGWIVTNPPYGERLQPGDDADLWRDWASALKRGFGGWQLHVISNDMRLPQQLRLKPLRRTPLHNGALDCRLFSFELVSAGYRDKPGSAPDSAELES